MEELSAQTEKAELRRYYQKARREYSSEPASKALNRHLRRWLRDYAHEDLQICAYRPLKDEAPFDLSPVHRYFYPRLKGTELEFLKPAGEGDFAPGAFGIEEPQNGQSLDPGKPMTVFCPAVAVDGRGARLGMGKGYYDRFFNKHPQAVRVGVVYQVQVSEAPLPAEEWDQPLDWIVTDKMILRTSQRSS